MKNFRAFTLIELLIVVLIIAILAAIALPNFLEFQTRAKVSRVKSDMRSAKTAIEAYRVDNDAYPILRLYFEGGKTQWDRGGIFAVVDLSTPISYLSSVNIPDPFFPDTSANEFGDIPQFQQSQGEVSKTINYVNIDLARTRANRSPVRVGYVLVSYGPDNIRGPIPGVNPPYIGTYANPNDPADRDYYEHAQYDPTNGTVSGGDILMWPGGGR